MMKMKSQFRTLDEYKEYLDDVAEAKPAVSSFSSKLLRNDKYINDVMADKSLSEREFVEIIAICRQVSYNRSTGGGSKTAENETDRLYAKNPWKFIEEFLQNADDCNYEEAPEISIYIDAQDTEHCSIEFCYNEEGFSRNDIWAITAFSESTKVNDTVKIQKEDGIFYKEKTGRKGKGFKSVFSLSAENIIVHIRSNGFSFKLDNNIGRIIPVWEEDAERMDGKTHVIVELDKPAFSVNDIYSEFRRLFCIDDHEGIFSHSPFLFMHRLRTIHVSLINKNVEETFITEYNEKKDKTIYRGPISASSGKALLGGIAKDGIYYSEQLQEGEITTISVDDVYFSIPLIRYTRMIEDEAAYRNYSIIAPLITSDSRTNWHGGALFRTFPMSLHPISVPMAIDAPFILNSDRSGVQYSPYNDEEGQSVLANEWNTTVIKKLFDKNGVFEFFFLWLRSFEKIRIDRYMSSKEIMLFNDMNNSDGHGKTWVPAVDISALYKKYPVFRLFAKQEGYVSYNDAVIVNRNLFSWPCVDSFFLFMLGEEYKDHIVSDCYIGSHLFSAKPIINAGFADSMNRYLDKVELELGHDFGKMSAFFNTQLYPYLKDNKILLNQKAPDAFRQMRIYLSKIKQKNDYTIVREALSDSVIWLYSENETAPLSINRYRVFESSPANLNILGEPIKSITAGSIHDYFGPENQHNAVRSFRDWEVARDYIEAAYHFGYSTEALKIGCLKNYVFSNAYDPEFNAFRIAKVLKVIPDNDIKHLAAYFSGNLKKTTDLLMQMGVQSGKDYFIKEGSYLTFSANTISLLRSDLCSVEILEDIASIRKKLNKKINVSYDTIKNFQENVLLYLLNEKNELFSVDSYTGICDQIQNNEKYWKRSDVSAIEILIRAMAGATEALKDRGKRNLNICIEDVLSRNLGSCIDTIRKKNYLKKLVITNNGYFEVIREEEIIPRLSILKVNTTKNKTSYYKGDLSRLGEKINYIKDIRGGNVYLSCDENGDYTAALAACLEKNLDEDVLKYVEEMEQQYQDVREQIIVPFFNKTGHDLGRTYNEIERRFKNYSKKQIICILSWFRSQGYTSPFGNGNINNEKEIEDDYRAEPWRFIYEFMQNVDDCSFNNRTPELKIVVDSLNDRIVFDYNEAGFSLEDVKAITQFGKSPKNESLDDYSVNLGLFNRKKTGRLGRGFKSVFSLPGNGTIVHILSNGFSFKFIKSLGSIIPIWEDVEDIPFTGTRITIEGFDSGYTDNLIPEIRKMFGIDDLTGFFANCPILYLRKLSKVTVEAGNETFSIDLAIKERKIDKTLFTDKGELIAGIMHNGQLKSSMWETMYISVRYCDSEQVFPAVRYSKMFVLNDKIQTASIFAPLMTISSEYSFSKGSFFCTLPLGSLTFPLPLSINAPFAPNSGRNALDENNSDNISLINFVFVTLLPRFYKNLCTLPEIMIERYIPHENIWLFGEYKRITKRDLTGVIQNIPILKRYDGNGYVSCMDAKTLPYECYGWPHPDILSECFDSSKEILVERCYVSLVKNHIILNGNKFVTGLNAYLNRLNFDGQSYFNLEKDYIYPYLDKNYETILRKYRADNRQTELNKLQIFIFRMADGSFVRENAVKGHVWITDAPLDKLSFGKYRSLSTSSLSGIIEHSWVKELHETVPFDEAFEKGKLDEGNVSNWDQARELIATILYYGIDRNVRIPYLSNCVLSKEFDGEENLFRDGYAATESRDIIDHLIEKNDLQNIKNIVNAADSFSLQKIADLIKGMGTRKPDDFLISNVKGIYTLKKHAIALLKEYCTSKKNAGKVLEAIGKAFLNIKRKNGGTLHISYEEIKDCDAAVFSRLFEYELTKGEIQRELAERFCQEYMPQKTDDYTEAYLRALYVIDKVPVKRSISISLEQIKERKLGKYLQECKLNNMSTLSLDIQVSGNLSEYPSKEIDQALHWLNDEKAVSFSYEYYTTDLSSAFGNAERSKTFFLFDDTKVLLHDNNSENCLLKFVQKRYKGKDTSFSMLISIITEQNELKKPWSKSKKEYIEKLNKFRSDTKMQKDVLFPDLDEHINDATNNPAEYVLPELLQNINDCARREDQEQRTLEVSINIQAGTMLLTYDEAGFDFSNVYSITALGQSTKHDESEGEKGLGFKKVFSVFDLVEIYSNGFCFSLSQKNSTIPVWIDSEEKREKYLRDGKTTMLFQTSGTNKGKLSVLFNQWKDLLNGNYYGNTISPLFLKNIDCIRVDGISTVYSRREMEKEFLFIRAPLLAYYEKLLCENKNTDPHSYLSRVIEALKTRKKCALMAPTEQDKYIRGLTVELCIPRRISEKCSGKGCFFSTLPTKDTLPSTLFINLPLELSTGRDRFKEDSTYNKTVFRILFATEGVSSSMFTRLLETLANENKDIFMLNYLNTNVKAFAETISTLTGKAPAYVYKCLEHLKILKAYKKEELVSLANSYSADRIIYQYLREVRNCSYDIESWMQDNINDIINYSLLFLSTVDECDKVENFAKQVGSPDGYFPIRQDDRDLMIEYMSAEYGCVKGDNDG